MSRFTEMQPEAAFLGLTICWGERCLDSEALAAPYETLTSIW